MLRLLVVGLAAVPSAALLVAPPAGAYSKLQGVQLTRASDARSVELTSLWRKDVAFGLGAVEGKAKVFAVGIGSSQSALKFAEAASFPAELLLADESEEVAAYTAIGARNTGRDERGKQIFEGVESMWSEKTNDALKARGRDDLNSVIGRPFKPGPYLPLMPTGPRAMERTFVQGGTFVFDGSSELFAHYDFSSGDHADLAEVVELATA